MLYTRSSLPAVPLESSVSGEAAARGREKRPAASLENGRGKSPSPGARTHARGVGTVDPVGRRSMQWARSSAIPTHNRPVQCTCMAAALSKPVQRKVLMTKRANYNLRINNPQCTSQTHTAGSPPEPCIILPSPQHPSPTRSAPFETVQERAPVSILTRNCSIWRRLPPQTVGKGDRGRGADLPKSCLALAPVPARHHHLRCSPFLLLAKTESACKSYPSPRPPPAFSSTSATLPCITVPQPCTAGGPRATARCGASARSRG